MIINSVDSKELINVGDYFFKLSGDDIPDDLKMYYINDNGINYFMSISSVCCTLFSIDKKQKLLDFLIDEEGKLTHAVLDDMKLKFEDIGVTMYKDGIMSSLLYEYCGENGFYGYDGEAIYAQRNYNNDVSCFIGFPHMYRIVDENLRPRLYGFNLEKYGRVHIDKNYSKTSDFSHGFTFNTHERFYKREISSGISSGDKIIKYIKAVYISPSGPKFVPYYGVYDESELKEHLLEFGLSTEVPSFLLDLYNDQVPVINDLKRILNEIKEKGLILSKKNLS